ncbi:uncharacterized protein LOC122818013 [Drosophila biarmipes]|uniref:uncharacterized protein LOC122818013 n=1 Tax=Drosophila biarmipes TaxID=125945 RepID=UPI001CDA683B|nr:uncharacterized protein LOC122818013 [Drosophila biarmipes]
MPLLPEKKNVESVFSVGEVNVFLKVCKVQSLARVTKDHLLYVWRYRKKRKYSQEVSCGSGPLTLIGVYQAAGKIGSRKRGKSPLRVPAAAFAFGRRTNPLRLVKF